MLEVISVSYLFAIGILFIGLEALVFSFVLFFLGIGFIVVAFISLFYSFESALLQIAVALLIAIISAFGFRKTLQTRVLNSSDESEERAHVTGIGIVEDGMIKFDGTYWKTLEDLSCYRDGDHVEVIDVENNMVVLKKES